ncbi:hypothetical protein [Peribacillus asahii]|uniref:hypothetical protein n=1 Tax=Peribacillus asahii TaxID=228899 RepID=UPI0020793B38|nr:hypothetical protein [Peribacillus asahii]USK86175.1 hypothetical protein LIT35_05905 [Peribacillus asahii]
MNNLQRLELETRGIKLEQDELSIYLQENDLQPFDEHNPSSATNKKRIYQSALSVLESIANDITRMKSVKVDDMSVSDFSDSIQSRIDQLERKIRTLKTDEQLQNESNFFMLFAD